MNNVATGASEPSWMLIAEDIPQFLQRGDFPASGADIAQVVQARGGPDYLVAALQRLTPEKLFHNVYEVWIDTVNPDDRHIARTSREAAQLTEL